MSGLLESDPVSLGVALNSPNLLVGDYLSLRGTFSNQYTINKNNLQIQSRSGELATIDGSVSVLTGVESLLLNNIIVHDSSFIVRDSNVGHASGVDLQAATAELRDLIIYDETMGIYVPNNVTSIILDGCILFFNGWLDVSTGPHGHGIYAKSNITIRNCIIFGNANFGIQIYGTGNRDNVTLQDNISFCTTSIVDYVPQCNIIHADGVGMVWNGNCTYNYIGRRRPNDFGYGGAFSDAVMINNYLPEGYTNSGSGTFSQQSGNVLAPEAANHVRVISVRGRAHVAVYNWELLDTVEVDVSSIFSPGDSVSIINVMDYFVDRATSVVDGNGKITVDMRATNHSIAVPQGLTSPVTPFPEFGCFVIRKIT